MKHCHFEVDNLDEQTLLVHISRQNRRLSFHDVLSGWSRDTLITEGFTRMIAAAPFDALYWEMPPLSIGQLERDYECVMIDSPMLAALASNPIPFEEYFAGAEKVVVFRNLGADALLIAPVPEPRAAQFTHIAAFCRTAAPELTSRFWHRLGDIALENIGQAPIWISTAGLGVGWLHARLDSSPKYYSYAPYRYWPERMVDGDA